MQRKPLIIVVAAVLAVPALWFAWYALSPLWITVRLDEAAPDAAVPAVIVPPRESVAQENGEESAATGDSAAMEDERVPAPVVASPSPVVVIGSAGHPASGTARVLDASGKRYLRYENFRTINGPDLFVYLAKDLDAKEYVDLGRLRATEGNVNYEIPAGVDLLEYRYAMVWCEQFSVLFNHADVSAFAQ